MQLNRSFNAKRNMIYGFISKIITLLYPFIVRIFIIKEIGANFLGLTSLFSSILEVLNLTELGFSSAVVFSMYKPIAEDDNEQLCKLLNYYRKVYFIIGLVILCVGLVIMPFINLIIKGNTPDNANIHILFLIYLINSVISYLFFGYKSSLLNAFQREDVISRINSIVFIVVYTIKLWVVIYTKDYYYFAFCSVLSSVLVNLSVYFTTNKLFPNLKCKGTLTIEYRKDLKQKIHGIMIGKVTGLTRNSLDSIFMAMFLGLTETAIYNNYYTIMMSITGVMVIIYQAVIGGVGNSVAMESQSKNYEDLQKMNFIYMWISGFCSISLLCLYQPFMELVFGKDMLFPFITAVLFCLYFYVLKTGDIISLYSQTNGLWWKFKFYTIAELISNLVLNITLGKLLGANGIVLATMISMLFITNTGAMRVVFDNYFTEFSFMEYLRTHLKYFVVTIIVALFTLRVCKYIEISSFMGFCIKALICLIIPNVMYFIIYRKTGIYKKSVPWIKAVLKVNKA